MIDHPGAAQIDEFDEELDELLHARTAALIELKRTSEEIDRLLVARAAAGSGEDEA
jgi:hypothetical protein